MLVPMRQILDEAAKGGYGVGAFNVNNMEQIQAIMEAAKETKSPVIIQASRGARKYTNDIYLRHLMLAAAELYPGDPDRHAPGPRQQPRDLQARHRHGLHLRHDGRLADAEDGKTPARYEYNVEGHARRSSSWRTRRGVTVEGEIGVLGGIEDGHGAGGTGLEHLTDPAQAEEFVAEDRRGRPGRRHRHQPRRLQVHQQADRRRRSRWTA